MKNHFHLILLAVLSLALVGCIPAEKACNVDSDCVPDECCHAKGAVNIAYAPDCKDMLCTAECVPGTIDCGQGEIKCIDGRCKAVLK